jgi:uncharacterized membrane protein YfcA
MFAGLVVGERLRSRIPEAAFRKVFLVALLVLGVTIAASA